MSLLEWCGIAFIILVVVDIILLAIAIRNSMPEGEQDGSNPYDEEDNI